MFTILKREKMFLFYFFNLIGTFTIKTLNTRMIHIFYGSVFYINKIIKINILKQVTNNNYQNLKFILVLRTYLLVKYFPKSD